MRLPSAVVLLATATAIATAPACGRDAAPPPRPRQVADAARPTAAGPAGCTLTDHPVARPAPRRLVAIGDVHGDLDATRRALRLAGAIDDRDRWAGGDLSVIQLGDVLDRGDGEQAIVDLFERLEVEAAAAGGAFTWLLGNHELMNAAGDFRYVTPGGWRDFVDAPGVGGARAEIAEVLAEAPAEARPRVDAMLPGGVYARIFAGQDIATVIGDTVFSHAGLLPTWTADLAAMNRAARCWLDGAGGPPPTVAGDPDGPLWTRAWGGADDDCARLREVLGGLGVARMVVAHTPQLGGITSGCDGQLWRIDTGLASYYGGPTEVLEITAAGATVLSAP